MTITLPKVKYPYYETKIPSTGLKVKFRPFTVSEEKILLMAGEGNDFDGVKNAVKQIVENCTDGVGDVEDLTTFDMEFLFVQIRAKSVNSIANIGIRCDACSIADEEEYFSPVELDLGEVKIYAEDETGAELLYSLGSFKKNRTIKLNDELAVTLRAPNVSDLDVGKSILEDQNTEVDPDEIGFEMLARCTVSIFTSDTTYYAKDTTVEDLKSFYKDLPRVQLEMADAFFKTIPYIGVNGHATCKKCKAELTYKLKGLESFFA